MSERRFCKFFARGACLKGEYCEYPHERSGQICKFHQRGVCAYGAYCKDRHLEISQSQSSSVLFAEIECNICWEAILSKPNPVERRFGILSGCNHSFCLSCIREWRGRVPTLNSMRTCPVCRQLSDFIVPSLTWYTTAEEKQEIINGYKVELSLIECKYFNFGRGVCHFGCNCFYKHTMNLGNEFSLQSEEPSTSGVL